MRNTVLQEIIEKVEQIRQTQVNEHRKQMNESRKTENRGYINESRRLQRLAGITSEAFEDIPMEDE